MGRAANGTPEPGFSPNIGVPDLPSAAEQLGRYDLRPKAVVTQVKRMSIVAPHLALILLYPQSECPGPVRQKNPVLSHGSQTLDASRSPLLFPFGDDRSNIEKAE